MDKRFSIAELAFEMTGTFEAELLVELMLREWKHPLAGSEEFRTNLLESAAEALRASIAGEQLIDAIPPEKAAWLPLCGTLNPQRFPWTGALKS